MVDDYGNRMMETRGVISAVRRELAYAQEEFERCQTAYEVALIKLQWAQQKLEIVQNVAERILEGIET